MSEFSSIQRHCSVLKWRQLWSGVSLGLWGCLVVSQRPILSADVSIFACEQCMRVCFSTEWLVCFLQILSTEATAHETHTSGCTIRSASGCQSRLFTSFYLRAFILIQTCNLWLTSWSRVSAESVLHYEYRNKNSYFSFLQARRGLCEALTSLWPWIVGTLANLPGHKNPSFAKRI